MKFLLAVAACTLGTVGCADLETSSMPVPAPSAATAAVPREFFGVVSLGLNPPSAGGFDTMGAGHVGTFRSLLNWSTVEPTPGRRNWASYDAMFTNAARNGIRVMPTLYGSPRFAAPVETAPPITGPGRRAFTRFVSDAVARYGNGGTFWRQFTAAHPGVPALPVTSWQLWNEVNSPGFWLRKPNARQYARLLKPTATAIRRADPSAHVVLAGLFPRPRIRHGVPMRKWLAQLYKVRKIRSFFDAVAVHPYARRPGDALKTVGDTRRLLRRFHDRKAPIWVTELGWATGGSPSAFTTTLTGQARNLQVSFGALANNSRKYRIAGVIWYALRDAYGSDNWAYHTGLFDAGGRPKPAWNTFVRFAGGSPY